MERSGIAVSEKQIGEGLQTGDERQKEKFMSNNGFRDCARNDGLRLNPVSPRSCCMEQSGIAVSPRRTGEGLQNSEERQKEKLMSKHGFRDCARNDGLRVNPVSPWSCCMEQSGIAVSPRRTGEGLQNSEDGQKEKFMMNNGFRDCARNDGLRVSPVSPRSCCMEQSGIAVSEKRILKKCVWRNL
jgi:hypothetical protein